MENYIHKVQYYETDKMQCAHHSNYIRWMEEARVNFLEKIGFGYDKLEKQGIVSPVIGIECEFKEPTYFGDEVEIKVNVEEFKGVKLVIGYEMINKTTGKLTLIGQSKHCFINKDNRPIILRKEFPDFDKKLKEIVKNNDNF